MLQFNTKLPILTLCLFLSSLMVAQVEIEHSSSGVSPTLLLAETSTNSFTRLFFTNNNSDKQWRISSRAFTSGLETNKMDFNYYNGSSTTTLMNFTAIPANESVNFYSDASFSDAVALGNTFATGYKLTVDGKIICEELQVLLKADWPDYVFEEKYHLMPLAELRDYLNEHKHLPGIPTAAEVSEEGIAVGEMQKMMMEKIEELTLYMLELEKEVNALKLENETLKK